MFQPDVTSVQHLEGGRLLLTYTTGEGREFDVKPYMDGPWYGELRYWGYFSRVSVCPDGHGVEWPHGQDVAPHELYELSRPVKMA